MKVDRLAELEEILRGESGKKDRTAVSAVRDTADRTMRERKLSHVSPFRVQYDDGMKRGGSRTTADRAGELAASSDPRKGTCGDTGKGGILDEQLYISKPILGPYQEHLIQKQLEEWLRFTEESGWDDYVRYIQERGQSQGQGKETVLDKLGRYMSGNTRDTTLPFYIDEIQLAEGHREKERGDPEPNDRWTNTQKAEFGALWSKSPDEARSYARSLNEVLDEEKTIREIARAQEWSTKNPFNAGLATVGSILASPAAGLANYLNDLTAYGTLGYIPKSDGTADLWEISQSVTSAISKKLNDIGTLPKAIPVLGGKGLGDAYGLGTNVVQSTLAGLAGGPPQAVVSFLGPAAAAAKDDALSRGADDETALIYGGVIGLIEAGAEAIGAENVTKLISSGGLKALFASPGMGEALEEGAASLAGFIADVLILREDSEFARRVAEYEKDGKSRAGAVAGAAWDTLEDILYDSLAGGISGEVHAGMAKALSAVSKAFSGRNGTAASGRTAASTDAQPKAPAFTGPQTNASSNTASHYTGTDSRSKPRIAGTMTNADIRDTDASAPDRADVPKTAQPEGAVPYLTTDHWTGELEGLWTETDTRTAGDTAIDMDGVYGAESETDTGKAELQQPVRYEDALKAYVQGDTRFSAKPDVQTGSPDAAPNADPTAGPDTSRETAPKPMEQVIAELAPKLQTANMTPGRAMIAAQEMYAEAEKWYGSNADAILEMFQPGQDPRKFLDGFRNAYLSGKMGSRAALENSTAAAYVTDSQRTRAYDLGAQGRMSTEQSKDILWRTGEGYIENSQERGIIKPQKFNTKADPMREVTGPGIKSHPSQINEMISEMERYGVEINHRGSGMAYSPGIMPGDPGQLIIEEEASYSAWMHEYKHFCDIRDAGFPGMRIFMDTEKCIRMEIDAYSVEISMAESMNRPDIAERLRVLMRNEVDRFG